MKSFTSAQLDAIQAVSGKWPDQGIVLVGASALTCWMDMNWRQTQDLDLSLAVDIEEMGTGLATLPGWRQDAWKEHEWHAPGDVKVDVIPSGHRHLTHGSVRWPRSGFVMSLLGFRLAVEASEPVALGANLVLRVAPLPVLLLLKSASYLDRPSERRRDLDDIAHVLREGIPAEDRMTAETMDAQVSFETASAFLLGRRLGALMDEAERSLLETFLAKARDARDADQTLAWLERSLLRNADDESESALPLLAALEAGLSGPELTSIAP